MMFHPTMLDRFGCVPEPHSNSYPQPTPVVAVAPDSATSQTESFLYHQGEVKNSLHGFEEPAQPSPALQGSGAHQTANAESATIRNPNTA